LNGQLQDEKLIKMAEIFAQDDVQLQEDYTAINSCSQLSYFFFKIVFCSINLNFAEGMDECDTVALIFQCGQERAPVFTFNAIRTIELSSSAMVMRVNKQGIFF
jgi:hypothetical protein